MPFLCVARAYARIARAMAAQCAYQFVRFLASVGAKFPKMGDSLPCMPTNHRAKFDATSFIVGRKIHKRSNERDYKQ